jgi:hypothetical protein
MLEPVKLVDAWRRIESELPAGWADARLRVHISDPTRFERAAAALAPLTPGRVGTDALVLSLRRASAASNVRKLLSRLDAEGIGGTLELVGAEEPLDGHAVDGRTAGRQTLVSSWDAELAALPEDWSDLLVEVELESSDQIARAALLLAPCNPTRAGGLKTLRFRCARTAGYGASPGVARRCLERLDEEGVRGSVRILHVLSDTDRVDTLGPVWHIAGRSV